MSDVTVLNISTVEFSKIVIIMCQSLKNTVELQWLEQAGTMKISSSERQFQPSMVSFYINLNSRDPSPKNMTSVVSVFVLLQHRSLKQKMKITA